MKNTKNHVTVRTVNKLNRNQNSAFNGNIENYVGLSEVPMGVAGPVTIHGSQGKQFLSFPLSTTEGALVASYNRGCKAIELSGGATSFVIETGVQRSPLFVFNSIPDLIQFKDWILSKKVLFNSIVAKTSSYALLQDITFNEIGRELSVVFNFSTGDAAGQNMVTICTKMLCDYINQNSPVEIVKHYIESNYSGDKKANFNALNGVRGRKVIAEVNLKEEVIKEVLKSSSNNIYDYWVRSSMQIAQSGAVGMNGHFANGLAALFIATGQDVACVSEASIGINRMEKTTEGLYVSVTMPNLIVGTVGGGTKLPTQKKALEFMGCYGVGNANKFAEACAVLAIAGEISIAAAITEQHFCDAHMRLGRS